MYSLHRHFAGASRYALEISKGSQVILKISVQLYLTPHGRLHVGALHPAEVTFSGAGATDLSYDTSQKTLSNGQYAFKRHVGMSYQLCAYDTIWRQEGEAGRALRRLLLCVRVPPLRARGGPGH